MQNMIAIREIFKETENTFIASLYFVRMLRDPNSVMQPKGIVSFWIHYLIYNFQVEFSWLAG